MPPRTNPFQQLIFDIRKQIAGSATVTESKMFTDKITGELREVDIVIEADVAGTPIVLSIECVDHNRKNGHKWVEEMYAKHSALPTNKLILCSRKGFTSGALKKASFYGIYSAS